MALYTVKQKNAHGFWTEIASKLTADQAKALAETTDGEVKLYGLSVVLSYIDREPVLLETTVDYGSFSSLTFRIHPSAWKEIVKILPSHFALYIKDTWHGDWHSAKLYGAPNDPNIR